MGELYAIHCGQAATEDEGTQAEKMIQDWSFVPACLVPSSASHVVEQEIRDQRRADAARAKVNQKRFAHGSLVDTLLGDFRDGERLFLLAIEFLVHEFAP